MNEADGAHAALNISQQALMRASVATPAPNPFVMPSIAPGVLPGEDDGGQVAMDSAFSPNSLAGLYEWASNGQFEEGIGFLGYPYLAQLAQRAEYRRPVEIIAEHATRKFIELSGDDEEKISVLYKQIEKFKLAEVFREAAELDGFFGRSHVYIDLGDDFESDELSTPLTLSSAKIGMGQLKGIRVIEPMWCYPGDYESTNPLSPDFYNPQNWYVMGRKVHSTRLMTLVGRKVPDMLKAAYAFGGLALTQMGKPYVDNWLTARQSASDLLNRFSKTALKTDMSSVLAGGCSSSILARAQMYTQMGSNRGLFVLDKESEDLAEVATPLTNVPEMVQQAQEQQASVFGIPLSILFNITPKGLNASSEGEVRTFGAGVHAFQERLFRDPVGRILDVLQLNIWGEIDASIAFRFPELWDMDERERAEINRMNADVDGLYLDRGVITQDEVRERLSEDEESAYSTVDLSAEADGGEFTDEDGEAMRKELDDEESPRAMDGKRRGADQLLRRRLNAAAEQMAFDGRPVTADDLAKAMRQKGYFISRNDLIVQAVAAEYEVNALASGSI